MIIAISGMSGCGKNSVGEAVAKALGLRPVQMSFKDEARKLGVTLMDVQRKAGRSPDIDKALDDRIVAEAAKGDCVVMTWLGPWMVKNADLRVWLNASEPERAKRVSQRDGMAIEEALEHVRKRDSDNTKRYKKYYNIDITDHSIFDIEVNTTRFSPRQSAEIIMAAALEAVASPGRQGD